MHDTRYALSILMDWAESSSSGVATLTELGAGDVWGEGGEVKIEIFRIFGARVGGYGVRIEGIDSLWRETLRCF